MKYKNILLVLIAVVLFVSFIAWQIVENSEEPIQDIGKVIVLDGNEYIITEGVHFPQTWSQDAWTMLCLERKDS